MTCWIIGLSGILCSRERQDAKLMQLFGIMSNVSGLVGVISHDTMLPAWTPAGISVTTMPQSFCETDETEMSLKFRSYHILRACTMR